MSSSKQANKQKNQALENFEESKGCTMGTYKKKIDQNCAINMWRRLSIVSIVSI
jgi:hypothetical protein